MPILLPEAVLHKLSIARKGDRHLDAMIHLAGETVAAHNYGPLIYGSGTYEYGTISELGVVTWCIRRDAPLYTTQLSDARKTIHPNLSLQMTIHPEMTHVDILKPGTPGHFTHSSHECPEIAVCMAGLMAQEKLAGC